MKKYNNLELIGFVILMIGFILFVLGTFVEIPFVSYFGNKLLLITSLGLLIWSLGRMRKEKEEKDNKK